MNATEKNGEHKWWILQKSRWLRFFNIALRNSRAMQFCDKYGDKKWSCVIIIHSNNITKWQENKIFSASKSMRSNDFATKWSPINPFAFHWVEHVLHLSNQNKTKSNMHIPSVKKALQKQNNKKEQTEWNSNKTHLKILQFSNLIPKLK